MTFDRKRPVILVIDDVEETRLGTARLLATDGYTVITAADDQEAILKICLQPPNLILLSLGFDVIRLRALAKRLRGRAGGNSRGHFRRRDPRRGS
jgi:CheY-like chemotaxis protein